MHETIPIPTRLKITSFATLVRAYEERGMHLRSKSDVLWRAVEQLVYFYSKQGTEAFTSVPEAVSYLESVGLSLATNSRSTRYILKAIADEAYLMEAGERVGRTITKASPEEEHMSPEDLRAAAERIAESLFSSGGAADES